MSCFKCKNCCAGGCSVDKDTLIAGGVIAAGAFFGFLGVKSFIKASKLKKKMDEPIDEDAEVQDFEDYKKKKKEKLKKKISKKTKSGVFYSIIGGIAAVAGILYLTPVKDKVLESDAVGRIKEIEIPKVDFSRIREIEIPKVDFSKVDVSKIKSFELPKVSLPKVSKLETLEAIKKLEDSIESLKKRI